MAESMFPNRAGTELAGAYREFRRGLLAYIQSKVENGAVAEDLLHEVFLKAMKALDRGQSPADLSAWLHRIASNTVIDHYRTRRPTAALPADLAARDSDGLPPPDQRLAHCLRPFIEELASPYRETLLATAIEGRTLRSVAAAEGVSESAIKSRVSRGRQRLRENLHRCCHIELSWSGRVVDYARRSAGTQTE